MRTNEERIEALHQRADAIREEKRTRTREVLTVGTGLLVVIFMALSMPRVVTVSEDVILPEMNASTFASSDALDLIVVAVVAFILGVSVTVFCYYMRKGKER